MIQSFRHKGLRRFFESGSAAGIQPKHAKRLRMLLAALDTAQVIVSSPLDGIHLEADQHRKLGLAVAARVREILG